MFQFLLRLASIISLLAVLATCSPNIEWESLIDLTKNMSWDYIVFTQQWPVTVCYAWKDRSVKNVCNFPKGLDSWTIHGVWPSDNSGASPQFCNSSWIFNGTKIEDLITNLTLHWPNIYAGTSQDKFWAHEWSKHGTCATIDKLIHNEFGYFNSGLEMAIKYNITISLLSAGVVPDASKSYSLEEFHAAAQTHFGVTPVVTCYKHKKNHKYLIKEIRLCVDRSLNPIDCEDSEEDSCPKDDDVHYPPMEAWMDDADDDDNNDDGDPGTNNKQEL